MATPPDDNRDITSPPADFFDEEDNYYAESEDDTAAGVAFQAIFDDVSGPDDPFASEEDTEENNPDEEPEAAAGSPERATIEALEYLARVGLPLSKLLDNVLLGNQTIRSDRRVTSAQTELLKSSVIPCALSRICKPPAGMCVRGRAHLAAKNELEEWALDTSKDILRKELVDYTASTKAPQTETEFVSKESLKDMTFDALFQQIDTHAPRLYDMLSNVCMATRKDRSQKKDSKFVCLNCYH